VPSPRCFPPGRAREAFGSGSPLRDTQGQTLGQAGEAALASRPVLKKPQTKHPELKLSIKVEADERRGRQLQSCQQTRYRDQPLSSPEISSILFAQLGQAATTKMLYLAYRYFIESGPKVPVHTDRLSVQYHS